MRYSDLAKLTRSDLAYEQDAPSSSHPGLIPVTIEGKTLFYADASVSSVLKNAAAHFVGHLVQVDTEMQREPRQPLFGTHPPLVTRAPAEVLMNMRIRFVQRTDVGSDEAVGAPDVQTVFGNWNHST